MALFFRRMPNGPDPAMSSNPKIIPMPNTAMSPAVVLHQALEEIDNIKSVIVIAQYNDDTFDLEWSQMKTSYMALADMMLDQTLRNLMFPGNDQ